jgi:hypothetical protein
MRMAELIDQRFPNDDWKQHVSDGRLQKAAVLLDERRRQSQSIRLVDCLQFSDKGQIVARDEELRRQTVFDSRRSAEAAVKKMERLRNNLAHAQEIPVSDWSTVVELCEFVTRQGSTESA